MFKILGILIIVWGLALLVGGGLVIHYYLPRRRKKHIQELEAENERLDQLISVSPRRKQEWRG